MRSIALLTALIIGNPPANQEEESREMLVMRLEAAKMVEQELVMMIDRLKDKMIDMKDRITELEGEVKECKASQKNGKNPTEDECIKLNRPFNQCGWRCLGRTNTVDNCVDECKHLIKGKKSKWCLDFWGPGF